MGYHRRNLLSYRIVYNPKRTITRLAVKNFLIKKNFPINAESCSRAGRSRLPFAAAFLHTLVYISNRLI